jgi:signal transduction histidine kinase
MQLSVRRPQGTLGDIYTGFRRRNEILGGLVLAVLLAALTALVVSTERARELARLQTVVAAGISHELRTPLASLTVAADHLKNGHVENVGQARRYGEIIEAQSRRLRHIVDQALALTSLSQSNAVPCSRPVSLPEMISASIDGLAPRIREAAIEIEWHATPDVPMITADPDLVLRCLTNLIENSVKYAGSGGWIQVSARGARHAGRPVVEVAVEDRGPGIPDEEMTAVFEPFYRGSSARQSRKPGSGLGLAIVKSAVEAHSGWIKLERAVPHGCKFRLFFPAADHDPAVHSTKSEVQHDAVPADTTGR